MRRLLRAGKSMTASVIARSRPAEKAFVFVARHTPRWRVSRALSAELRSRAATTSDSLRWMVLPTGAHFLLDVADTYADLYFRGEYEPEVTSFFHQVIKPGAVVFDLGANGGYFTILAASLAGPSGQVHAFEPNPVLAPRIRESQVANPAIAPIFINQVAVASKTAQRVPFYVSAAPGNTGVSALSLHYGLREGNAFDVSTITIDEYAQQHAIQRCTLMKIDIEGGEAEALRGMGGFLRTVSPQTIVCETVAGGEAAQLLATDGYQEFAITRRGLEPATPGRWGNWVYQRP